MLILEHPAKQECDANGVMKIHKVFNLTNVKYVNNTAKIYGGSVDLTHNKLRVVCFIRVVTFQNNIFEGSWTSTANPYHRHGLLYHIVALMEHFKVPLRTSKGHIPHVDFGCWHGKKT